ncbi:MAG TPA: DHA2 family efflux MFS transporter permease subunit [Gammaproteobacteria bacterium]|jgi:EmrB/QacA subfamily drug resistance transporter|nr:DHA2 family efflux MFS transporter permease subunit [Gammaproteobacteria bacterium]HIK76802.1 DHA2 family efflux MFS transporter permease subunit [Gammaproteobacteria bacterium]
MQLSKARIFLIMSSLVLSSVMASLDSSFTPIAIPDMIDKLDSSTSEIVWVALGYLIAASGPMLLAAKMADGYGHARFFQIGTLIYGLAMIACAWAPDANTLIILRFIQGFGMALFLPTTFAIATAMYGPDKRGSALGILQAANAVGFVMGPVFAGWLLDAYDWTAIFWARIPFAILAILLAFLALGFKHPFRFSERQQTYDYLGAVYLTLSLYGILYGCNKLPVEDNHLDPLVWIIFTLGFVLFYLFIKQERKHPDPLIDLSLFTKSNDFTKASIAFASVFASFPVYLFILPIIMINGLEMKAWDAGLALGLAALATLIISPIAGNLSDRAGPEKLCMSGAILTGVGYTLLFLVNADSTVLSILPAMALIGAGTGLFFSPNNNLMLASAPPERAGMVSGLFGVLRQSGYALGFAVTASLFTAIQNWFDLQWAYSSVKLGSLQSANNITDIYHQGSQWSPETLVFILHIGVLLCSSILIITLVNSIPKIRLHASRQISVVLASVLVAVVTMGSYSLTAPGTIVNSEDQNIIIANTPNVLAFGMSSRSYDLVEEANAVNTEGMGNIKSDDISSQAYLMRCGFCHGPNLEGIPGLGATLEDSLFLQNMDIQQTIQFLNAGRMPNSEDSISGGVMPSFSWLPDSELEEIAMYIKSQKISE